jgi:MoaA/NifB/PqqE/SkfB family radical SAM enzyme
LPISSRQAREICARVNAVIHHANIDRIADMIDQAVALSASRVEIAHVQYYGWALANRAKLMPTRQQVERAVDRVEALRERYRGIIVIDAVVPDCFARYPKAGRFYQRGIFSGAKDRGHQLWFSLIAMGYYLIEWLALRNTSAVMRRRSCAGR